MGVHVDRRVCACVCVYTTYCTDRQERFCCTTRLDIHILLPALNRGFVSLFLCLSMVSKFCSVLLDVRRDRRDHQDGHLDFHTAPELCGFKEGWWAHKRVISCVGRGGMLKL